MPKAAHSLPFLRDKYFVAQNYAELFCDRFFLVVKVLRRDGPGHRQRRSGIAGHSARRPHPNRTRTEDRAALASPDRDRLSAVRRIGRRSSVFSQHQDSALRTDNEQGEPF